MKSFKSLTLLVFACAVVTFSLAARAQAQTLTYLATFNGVDGSGPSTVIQATDGNFYATTAGAGEGAGSVGNVVRITPAGEISSIYTFCSQPHCPDGQLPETPPILGNDGNLYGVTSGGGSDLGNGGGWGTVYKLTLDGQLTTLYTFCTVRPCADGASPVGIMQAADGNFYGTTVEGGGESGAGVLFEITAAGEFSVVHTFCSLANCADGSAPGSVPFQGSDGSLIGTTRWGGTYGGGVVYSLSPSGTFNVVHTFFCSNPPCPRGYDPNGVVQDAAGNLFGTTYFGGSSGNGTAFEITTTHQFKLLHSFTYGSGTAPRPLTLGNDGNLYGTTEGINGYGTIFQITPAGAYKTLHNFTYGGGTVPYTGLYQAPNGNFYGAIEYYGNNSNGAEYTFNYNLGPLVQTAPQSGPVGTSVLIVGNGLTGSTRVTFNGVAAAFTVESDTYIKATVPTGATTGTVSVVTPSGTLDSYPQFLVTK
ncbi:MAG: choice-of-anchor tandem repeat GloVer-containing protein [Candidatus Sulfotelmatobacter sp.]